MLRIGVRAHDFGRLPADELAARIAANGLSCVQLALNKAIAGLDLKPGDLNRGLARAVGEAFTGHNVQIAVLGCYINLSNPDPAARDPLIAYFKDHLRHARDFTIAGAADCPIVATETGSLNSDWSLHPDNHSEDAYRALVPVVADLVETAERAGSYVGIEGVATHVLHSPRRIRQLLDDILSQHLQIVFDPVNLLTLENCREQDRVMQESFDLFGDRIAIIHAKDFSVENGRLWQKRTGGPGASLNYRLLLDWIKKHKPQIPILLEESFEETACDCIAYIQAKSGG